MLIRINDALDARRDALHNVKKSDDEKGFTLIELLVVVIIIGILAAIAIPVYLNVQNNAKDSAAKSDAGNAKTAIIAYQTDHNGSLPSPSDTLPGFTPTTEGSTTWTVGGNDAFCVQSVSETDKTFAATDTLGVAEGTCVADGVFKAAPSGS